MSDGCRSLAESVLAAALTMLLLIPSSAPSQNKIPDRSHVAKKQAMVAPFSAHPIPQPENWTSTPSLTGTERGGYFCVYNVEFKDANYRKTFEEHQGPGIKVFASFDQFADLFLAGEPVYQTTEQGEAQVVDVRCDNAASRVEQSNGVIWGEYIGVGKVPPPPSLVEGAHTRGAPQSEKVVRGGLKGYTGKGVLIAIIDSGIDFHNPEFIGKDASGRPISRLLYFWDTFASGVRKSSSRSSSRSDDADVPVSYPNGTPIGIVYTRDRLTADLRLGSREIPPTDTLGHGTSAAGIAAGSMSGVAPEADIIGVRIGKDDERLQHVWLLNAALAWIDRVARQANRPVVVSCSFGGHTGAHDGTEIQEREIDARFSNQVQGRAIVIAAGNELQDSFHAAKTLAGPDKPAVLTWFTNVGVELSIYAKTLKGTSNSQDDLMARVLDADGETVWEGKAPTEVQPISGDRVVTASLPTEGQNREKGLTKRELMLWNNDNAMMQADAYIKGGVFDVPDRSPTRMVGSPGTARQAITVGSYQWNDQFSSHGQMVTLVNSCSSLMRIGEISCYSNPGLVQVGYVKPEIVAPGEWYSAPLSTTVAPERALTLAKDTTGNYCLFNGTSAAAPYVAGFVALMMQKKPSITVAEIKSKIQENATVDFWTGNVPNPVWGYGKLDYSAAERILNAVH